MKRGALLGVAALAAIAYGCAVGPDFHRPPAPGVDGYTPEPLPRETASSDVAGGGAQRFVPALDIPERWWTLFGSEELNALVDEALRANPDMQAARAALRQAMELVRAQQGAFYPSVQANFSPTRQKSSPVLSPPLATGESVYNLYTAQVSVSYAPDVFGANRRQVESLRAQAEFQRFQLEAAYLTLVSNVVVAAIQESALRAQIAATEETIRIETEVLALLRRQYELGAIAMSDVAAQEATLSQTQATLTPLQKQLAQQRNLLARLIGRYPSQEPREQFDLSKLALPREIPVTLPARLVEQRPDVRAAEAQLHSASAQVGVAISNMFPQVALSADAGSIAAQIAQLGTPATAMWIVGASLTQTLSAGGALVHRKRAAEAVLDQAGAEYRSAVLNAFQNVADSLRALQYDANAVKAQVAAVRATTESLRIARQSVRLGASSYLGLLNAEQAYQQSVINLAQAQGSRYADTAALFQALGGGWWNRADITSDAGRRDDGAAR